MIPEFKIFYSAHMTGGGTSADQTHVECVDLLNDYHYTLVEVDKNGAVTKKSDGIYNRLDIADLKGKGVQVLRGVNDSPTVAPGESLKIMVGAQEVTIDGTKDNKIIFNGRKPVKTSEEGQRRRYPHFI